jgi:hypothetical protein
MSSSALTIGAGHIDRVIPKADDLLRQYRDDIGYFYLNYQPITPSDKVIPEDLAVTLLMNSQVGGRAFRSLLEHAHTIELAHLPKKPLEHTSPEERRQVAAMIAKMAQLPGFAASVATKVLHKKRPTLIPILDNQAIFGAYMYPEWPQERAREDSIKDLETICTALDWIAFDLNRPENVGVWEGLHAIEPARSRIELFDCVWWMYFRKKQPVKKRENNVDVHEGGNIMQPISHQPIGTQDEVLSYEAAYAQIQPELQKRLPVEARLRKPQFHVRGNRMHFTLDRITGSHYEMCFRRDYYEFALHFESTLARNVERLQAFEPHINELSQKLGHDINHGNLENKDWKRIWIQLGIEPLTQQKVEYYIDLFSKFIAATFPILQRTYEQSELKGY